MLSRHSCSVNCERLASQNGQSRLFAGTLPAEWGGLGSFPRLELLSICLTHISGDASVKDARIQDA